MTDSIRPHILFVHDAPLLEGGVTNLYNDYISKLLESVSKDVQVSIFYPVTTLRGEPYSLKRSSVGDIELASVVVPPRYKSFREIFSNSHIEEVFGEFLKEGTFSCVHFFSLKNLSLNLPFKAKECGIPTVMSVFDHQLLSPLPFWHENPPAIKLSNFVGSPLYKLFRRAESFIGGKRHFNWFEQVGRYSAFYNSNSYSSPDISLLEERDAVAREAMSFIDRFHFFSRNTYNSIYKDLIPQEKVFFMEQGIDTSFLEETRPFEIEGRVRIGFIGEPLPEEGIDTLVDAFSILKEKGYDNELHIFGEIFENRPFIDLLRKKAKGLNIRFHGPVAPSRVNVTMAEFEILAIPSRWHSSDTYLTINAIAARRAVLAPAYTEAGSLVKGSGRGIVFQRITAEAIASSIIDLEENRKRLYYYMRIIDDFRFTSITQNVQQLLRLYGSFPKKDVSEKVMLGRKHFKRKADRRRGV